MLSHRVCTVRQPPSNFFSKYQLRPIFTFFYHPGLPKAVTTPTLSHRLFPSIYCHRPFLLHPLGHSSHPYGSGKSGSHRRQFSKAFRLQRAISTSAFFLSLSPCSIPSPKTSTSYPPRIQTFHKDLRTLCIHLYIVEDCTQEGQTLQGKLNRTSPNSSTSFFKNYFWRSNPA